MRSVLMFAGFLALSLWTVSVNAASSSNSLGDLQALQVLEAKALQAQPREQCYLYAKLVREMTELSLSQYKAGDVKNATGLLERVQQFASIIHRTLSGNDKRIKNTELLLRQTSFRLYELLRSSNYQDRPLLEQTLAQVNQADSAAMMSVFSK